jgi:hypothetical protein
MWFQRVEAKEREMSCRRIQEGLEQNALTQDALKKLPAFANSKQSFIKCDHKTIRKLL